MQLMRKQKSQAVQKSEQNLKLYEEKSKLILGSNMVYVNNLVGDVKANPKDFYRYINSQKKDARSLFWIYQPLSWKILLLLRKELQNF